MAKTGDILELTKTVKEEDLAYSMKSGCLRVLATPIVVAFMEEAALDLVQTDLPDGITTVGTAISIEHISPTPLGAEVKVKATLTDSDGRFFNFDVEASDKMGLIAKGTHTRASVKSEKFEKKAAEKFNEV